MAIYTPINELPAHYGTDVSVAAWVSSVRNQKKMQFLVLRDQTGLVQAVNEKRGDNLEQMISSLSPESTVVAHGRLIHDDHIRLNQMEIQLKDLEVTSQPLGPPPLDEKSSNDARLDYRFFDLRSPKNNLIFQIQTTAEHAMRTYWVEHGFIEIHSPKLVSGATESGAELFKLDYFGIPASLAQSPQFYKQMAMAAGFERVFEIGPVFRANPSHTSRHDTEFTSVDMEMSLIKSHEDVMAFEERWLQYVLEKVKDKHGDKIKEHFGVDVKVPSVPFPRVSMKDAYDILQKSGHVPPREIKGDLDPEGERRLAQHVKDNFGHEFVFVTDYPISARPFYHMRHEDEPDTTKSFDLIWKGVEVTTGAQREHRHQRLLNQSIEKNIAPEAIADYLGFFKQGCPPHGGFGFGLTRMLMMMLETPNVREVTYLYRGPNRLTP